MPGTTERTKRAWDLALQGRTPAEIATALGVKPKSVYGMIYRGRNKGLDLKRVESSLSPRYRLRKAGIDLGNMRWVFKHLSAEQQTWAVQQALDYQCETLSEFILEVLRDTFEEHVSQKEAQDDK